MPPRRATLLLLLLAAACSSRQRFEDAHGSEGLIEVLPREAMVDVDGNLVGSGSRVLPVRDPRAVHRVVARAPGFETLTLSIPGDLLVGGRVGLVLRPVGFGVARPLEYDQPEGLTAAAALLLHDGRTREATEYAQRAADVAPDAPEPHRLLGDAFARDGRGDRAAQEYAAYLERAPADAADRARVEERISQLRGDVSIPGRAR